MKYLIAIVLFSIFVQLFRCDLDQETKSAASLANDEFALDLLKQLQIENENHFFSPFSISAAFAMTSLGAKKNTLEEIKKTFHFDEVERISNEMAIHNFFKEFLYLYANENTDYSLDLASRLFIQKEFEVLQEFLGKAEEHYNASVGKVDFASGKAEGIINQWIEKQTNNKIKQFYPPNFFTSDIVLALVNAIYFKGYWIHQFNELFTDDEEFHVDNDNSHSVEMMKIIDRFPYIKDEELNVKAIKLPYKGDHLSMLIILPEQGYLTDFISQLTANTLRSLIKGMRYHKVMLHLPKFKLETKYSLKDVLSKLYIKDLFTRDADLSRLSTEPLYVSSVDHKAMIEVNENGTEAAAATGITFALRLSFARGPIRFIVNRPFFFAIVDNRLDNLMLFTGTIVKP